LIERLLRFRGADVSGVRVDAGDDAAILRPPPDTELVVTTDTQIERTHFRWDWLDPGDVGFRGAMACHSDLAAMGAMPWVACSSLAIPPRMQVSRITTVQRGLDLALRDLGARLVGGNVARAADAFSITLAAVGLAPSGRAVTRTGARPGEAIWCSGRPGSAALGRIDLAAGRRRTLAARTFRRPRARIQLGSALAEKTLVSSMIDVSDGIAGDLAHILGPHRGATLDRTALLADRGFVRRCRHAGLDAEDLILTGGEDYELLFTVPRRVNSARIHAVARRAEVEVRRIGEVREAPGIRLVGGDAPTRAVPSRGFRHEVGGSGS
jgi:thiamine-monophosphate kinase